MTDVRGYTPGGTGTLADVVEQGPDLRQVRPAGPDSFAPPPGLGELLHAGRVQSRGYRTDFDEVQLRDGYAPIVDALGLGGSQNPAAFFDNSQAHEPVLMRSDLLARQGGSFLSSMTDRSTQEGLIAGEIRARRAKDKNFLPGVPDSVDGLHRYFLDQEASKRQAASATIARSSGLGDALAVFAGGGIETFHDPVNLLTLPIGGGGGSLVKVAARDALVNGLLEAAQVPIAAHNLDELGQPMSAGEAVSDVVTAGAFGGLLGGTIHAAGEHVPPALFKVMPESVQQRWAGKMKVGPGKDAPLLKDVVGDMDNRELAGFARSSIGPRLTPDEKAAADVLERTQDLGDASPFEPGPAGDAAHNENLTGASKALIDGQLRTSTSPIALRSPAPVAVSGHAGFDAQWSAIKGNEHGIGAHGEFLTSPKGAIGPAQVMPGTAPYAAKLAGVPFDEHRYRTDAAYNEQLGRAYYAEQLQTFGDPAMAAAAYNAGPGSAARGTGLRGALRRAAEHGEPGNWEAYLPRETQHYVADFRRRTGAADNGGDRAIADVAGGDDLAALQRSADDAEAEALSLSRDRGTDVDLAGDRSLKEEVPVLKRELFGSDGEWADAQADFHASLNAPEDPPARESGSAGVGQSQSAEGGSAGPQTLQQWFGQSLIADEHGRPLTVYHGSGSEFDTFDVGRAGEGRGSPDERALFFSTDPDVASHSALVAGAGHATGEPTHTGAFSDNGGVVYPVHLRVENPLISKLQFYNGEEFAREIAKAKAAGHDGVIFPHVRSRGENGTVAVFSPDQVRSIFAGATNVRIDEPSLKAFDDAGAGRGEQVDSLEHDARMAAADPEIGKRSYTLTDNGKPQTLLDILEALDRDRDAVAALRVCAGAA